jgi:hypothetical protein
MANLLSITPEDQQRLTRLVGKPIPNPNSKDFGEFLETLRSENPEHALELEKSVAVVTSSRADKKQRQKAASEAKSRNFVEKLFYRDEPDGRKVFDKRKISGIAIVGALMVGAAFASILSLSPTKNGVSTQVDSSKMFATKPGDIDPKTGKPVPQPNTSASSDTSSTTPNVNPPKKTTPLPKTDEKLTSINVNPPSSAPPTIGTQTSPDSWSNEQPGASSATAPNVPSGASSGGSSGYGPSSSTPSAQAYSSPSKAQNSAVASGKPSTQSTRAPITQMTLSATGVKVGKPEFQVSGATTTTNAVATNSNPSQNGLSTSASGQTVQAISVGIASNSPSAAQIRSAPASTNTPSVGSISNSASNSRISTSPNPSSTISASTNASSLQTTVISAPSPTSTKPTTVNNAGTTSATRPLSQSSSRPSAGFSISSSTTSSTATASSTSNPNSSLQANSSAPSIASSASASTPRNPNSSLQANSTAAPSPRLAQSTQSGASGGFRVSNTSTPSVATQSSPSNARPSGFAMSSSAPQTSQDNGTTNQAQPDSPQGVVAATPGVPQTSNQSQPNTAGQPSSGLPSVSAQVSGIKPLESVIPNLYLGARIPAKLVLEVVAVEAGETPIVAETTGLKCGEKECPRITWIGFAKLGPDRRVWAVFNQAVADTDGDGFSETYSLVGSAVGSDLRTGLSAAITDEAPSLISDLLRGAIGTFSDYLTTSVGAKTTTIIPGGAQTSSSVPNLGSFFLGRLGSLFSIPADNKALIRVARVSLSTEMIVLFGINAYGQR